jgi:predicted DsbA family dithiol-disulfide isomerase
MKVEVYSDVMCPWCYIGMARFERALEQFAGGGSDGADGAEEVEVVYRPYQLDPDAPGEAVPMLEYLDGRFGTGARAMAYRVSETARDEGLEIDFDRGWIVNTLDAHRLLGLAEREYGLTVQREVATALFAAHFRDGVNVGDPEVLARIGVAAGMNPARIRDYLESEEGTDEVREWLSSAKRLGIGAVPTFVFNGTYAVQGAQSASTFLRALRTAAREVSTAEGEGVGRGGG